MFGIWSLCFELPRVKCIRICVFGSVCHQLGNSSKISGRTGLHWMRILWLYTYIRNYLKSPLNWVDQINFIYDDVFLCNQQHSTYSFDPFNTLLYVQRTTQLQYSEYINTWENEMTSIDANDDSNREIIFFIFFFWMKKCTYRFFY